MRYEPVDAALGPLSMRQGRKVVVLRDPYNLADAVAVEEDTHVFIGELRVQQFIAQCPGGRITRDQIAASMRMQRSLQRAYNEWLVILAAISSRSGWRSPKQQLLDRAGLSLGAAQVPGKGSLGIGLSPEAIPGARQPKHITAAAAPVSPFVDDAAQRMVDLLDAEESEES